MSVLAIYNWHMALRPVHICHEWLSVSQHVYAYVRDIVVDAMCYKYI